MVIYKTLNYNMHILHLVVFVFALCLLEHDSEQKFALPLLCSFKDALNFVLQCLHVFSIVVIYTPWGMGLLGVDTCLARRNSAGFKSQILHHFSIY